MGSFFKNKADSKAKYKRSREAKLMSKMPPIKSSEPIDPKAVLKAPDVDLKGKLPKEAAEVVCDHILAGCRGILIDPEDEETRIFAIYEDRLVEIGGCDVKSHADLLYRLKACVGGAVTCGEKRYQIQEFESLSDFGSRLVLNFFEEGKFDTEAILQRRRENIKLVNKLKPATSLTRKNILDLHRVVTHTKSDQDFLSILLKNQLISQELYDKANQQDDPVMYALHNQVLPRKAAASALADYLEIEYVDVEAVDFDKRTARLLDKEWALQNQVVPYGKQGDRILVAMMDPTDSALIKSLEEKLGCGVEVACSAAQDIMVMIHKAHKAD